MKLILQTTRCVVADLIFYFIFIYYYNYYFFFLQIFKIKCLKKDLKSSAKQYFVLMSV